MSIKSNAHKKTFIKKYINLAIKENFISKAQADILKYNIERYGVIMILKNRPTKDKKTLKLISKSIPENIDQIQIEGIEKTNKGKLMRVFALEKYDIDNETPNIFLRISGIRPRYVIINKDLNKSSIADFVHHVLLKKGKDMFFNCANYNYTVSVFEIIAESKKEAFEKLNELYLNYLSNVLDNESPDEDYIEKIKDSISCIISVNVDNEKECYIEDIEFKNTNNLVNIEDDEVGDTEDFDNYVLQRFREEKPDNNKKNNMKISDNLIL